MKSPGSKLLMSGCVLAVMLAGIQSLSAALKVPYAISSKAAIMIRLKSPEKTIEQGVNFLNEVQPGFGGILLAQSQGLGVLISNPTMAGVSQKEHWYVAAIPRKDAPPSVLFAIPTTNADEFKKALGERFKSFYRDGYLFYSQDADTLNEAKQLLSRKGTSIVSLMDEHSKKVFQSGQLSVFVNFVALKELYGENFKQAREQFKQKLQNLPADAQQNLPPGVSQEEVVELVLSIVDPVLQLVEDSQSLTSTFRIARTGLVTECYLHTKEDSPSDQFLRESPPIEMTLLRKMPPEKLVYYGVCFQSPRLVDWASKITEKTLKIINAALKNNGGQELGDAELYAKLVLAQLQNEMAGCFWVGSVDQGLLRGAVVIKTKDAEKLKETNLKVLQTQQTVKWSKDFKVICSVKKNAEKVGGHSVDIVRYKYQYDTSKPEFQIAQKIVDTVYGPEGMTIRLVSTDDAFVTTIGGDQQTLAEILNSLQQKQGKGDQTAHQVFCEKYIPKSNALALIDLPNLILKVTKTLIQNKLIPLNIDPRLLNSLTLQSSYSGFGVLTEEHGLTMKLAIPAAQLQGIGQLVTFAQQVFLQMQMQKNSKGMN